MPVIKDYHLTKREIVVLKLISMGCTNRQIAAKLFISAQTVKKHMRNIFSKQDVNNRITALKKFGIDINTPFGELTGTALMLCLIKYSALNHTPAPF